jgi:hypothetical protein
MSGDWFKGAQACVAFRRAYSAYYHALSVAPWEVHILFTLCLSINSVAFAFI